MKLNEVQIGAILSSTSLVLDKIAHDKLEIFLLEILYRMFYTLDVG